MSLLKFDIWKVHVCMCPNQLYRNSLVLDLDLSKKGLKVNNGWKFGLLM